MELKTEEVNEGDLGGRQAAGRVKGREARPGREQSWQQLEGRRFRLSNTSLIHSSSHARVFGYSLSGTCLGY